MNSGPRSRRSVDVSNDDAGGRLLADLANGPLRVEGRLRGASNATLRAQVQTPAGERTCVYKPVSGERALWDFPEWTITRRELAAYELARAAGWSFVPPTAWREDGPAGEGMCQLWIEQDADACPVDVVRPRQVPDGWRAVLEAEDGAGTPVVLVHADDERLQRVAVFDVLANNADRKGGHVLADDSGIYWAIDHGVTFSVDDKLRTVLWGWAGEAIPVALLDEIAALADRLAEHYDPVDRWLADDEREALRHRVRDLLAAGRFPEPGGRWPAIPWPVF